MAERIIAQANRTKRYADYVQHCRECDKEPLSFREFAEADDEYERAWEIVIYEYEHGDINDRKG